MLKETSVGSSSPNINPFRDLVEMSQDLHWQCDLEGRYVYLNPAWERVFGYPIQEMLGHKFTDFQTPEQAAHDLKRFDQLLNGQLVEDLETVHLGKSGQPILLTFFAKALKDDSGNVIGTMGTAHNKTDLIRHATKYHSLFDGNRDAVMIQDETHFLECNAATLEMFGCPSIEDFCKLHPGNLSAEFQAGGISAFVLANQKISEAFEQGSSHFEWLSKRWDNGKVFPTEILLSAMSIDGAKVLLATVRDISRRKEAEELFSMLFQSMTEMVVLHEVIFDSIGTPVDYRITSCNPAFSKVTGVPSEFAVGKLASEVYGMSPPPYLTEFTQVGITGEPFEYTTYFKPMDKHFSISVVSPRKNTFATITTDITDVRHVQEAISEKNKELENYLYVASHDLRAPLVNLQGFSQKLESDLQDLLQLIRKMECPSALLEQLTEVISEEIPKSVKFISSCTAKMDNLINGLLRISRTGRLEMRIEMIDMNQLWKTIISANHFQISENNVQIEIGPLPPCFGDREQLNQLFSNLLGNAIKYRDPSRPLRIEVSGKEEFNQVQYCVRDNGIGIEERHLKRIWDVFFRVNAHAPQSGDGLGLSIVKRIAERHLGKVWVDSQAGQGSSFYIELKRQPFKVDSDPEVK